MGLQRVRQNRETNPLTKILKAIKIKAIAQSFIKVDNMQTAKGIEQKPYWEISMFPPSEFIYR